MVGGKVHFQSISSLSKFTDKLHSFISIYMIIIVRVIVYSIVSSKLRFWTLINHQSCHFAASLTVKCHTIVIVQRVNSQLIFAPGPLRGLIWPHPTRGPWSQGQFGPLQALCPQEPCEHTFLLTAEMSVISCRK